MKLRSISAAVLAGTILVGAAPAAADTTDMLDIEAGLGFSSNPFLRIPSQSTAFGRLSLTGLHSIRSEKGTTTFRAYLENTSYVRDYGSKQIFDLNAHTDQAVSPTVTVYGDLDFSGDFAGQLSNRLIGVPSQPPVVDPANPLPPGTTNPDLFGLQGRQYRLSGNVGASIRSGERGTISLSGGAQHLFFTGRSSPDDYNIFFASGGYTTQLSERTSVGGTLYLQRQDFKGSSYSNIVNPTLTLHTQLRPSLTADAGVGVMIVNRHDNGDSSTYVTPSFSAGLCSNTKFSTWCAHISRDAASALNSGISTSGGTTTITTSGSLTYFRRLGEKDTLQASLSASRYSSPSRLSTSSNNFSTTYVSGVVGYDRKLGQRWATGVNGGVRKLFQDGPDPKLDLNASIYVRYRLGDLL
jgi:hypothetical protein